MGKRKSYDNNGISLNQQILVQWFAITRMRVVQTIICEGGLCETEYFRANAEFLSESQKVKKF